MEMMLTYMSLAVKCHSQKHLYHAHYQQTESAVTPKVTSAREPGARSLTRAKSKRERRGCTDTPTLMGWKYAITTESPAMGPWGEEWRVSE